MQTLCINVDIFERVSLIHESKSIRELYIKDKPRLHGVHSLLKEEHAQIIIHISPAIQSLPDERLNIFEINPILAGES